MRLTPREDRPARLLARGVPETFLQVVGSLKERADDLEFEMQDEDAAYHYLASASEEEVRGNWPELEGQVVTPVYGSANGDVFLLLCESDEAHRFVWFGLEENVMTDHGADFQRALADLVIRYYENGEQSSEAVVVVAGELGLRCGPELVAALERSTRGTWEEDREWRQTVLVSILQIHE